MARTTAALVKGILGDNYGPLASGSLPSLTPFIDTATAIVDRVNTCATAKGITLSSTELELIERWLAAHCYAQMDMLLQSKSTMGASGSFQGQTGMYLESTRYGQMAISIDYSGCLLAISKRQVASGFWAGMTPQALSDYLEDQDNL